MVMQSHNPPFFTDVHSFLHNITGEITRIRETLEACETAQQQNCDKVRKDIEQERFEARDCMNKFRYEFDELVHKRVETVLEGLEQMEQSQKAKDRMQQAQIDHLEEQMNGLTSSLSFVNQQWGRLRSNTTQKEQMVKERVKQVSTGHRRRTSLQIEMNAILKQKEDRELYQLADAMRCRLKGAAQFVHGEDWERELKSQDKDGSGQIDFAEFRDMCRNPLKLQEPDRTYRMVFDSLDGDKSGEINMAELIEFVADPAERMRARVLKAVRETGNDWRRLVKEIDSDKSGQINFGEFKRLCTRRLGMLDSNVHLAAVFAAVDSDHSGEVSIRELTAWVEGKDKR